MPMKWKMDFSLKGRFKALDEGRGSQQHRPSSHATLMGQSATVRSVRLIGVEHLHYPSSRQWQIAKQACC